MGLLYGECPKTWRGDYYLLTNFREDRLHAYKYALEGYKSINKDEYKIDAPLENRYSDYGLWRHKDYQGDTKVFWAIFDKGETPRNKGL